MFSGRCFIKFESNVVQIWLITIWVTQNIFFFFSLGYNFQYFFPSEMSGSNKRSLNREELEIHQALSPVSGSQQNEATTAPTTDPNDNKEEWSVDHQTQVCTDQQSKFTICKVLDTF